MGIQSAYFTVLLSVMEVKLDETNMTPVVSKLYNKTNVCYSFCILL